MTKTKFEKNNLKVIQDPKDRFKSKRDKKITFNKKFLKIGYVKFCFVVV